MPRTRTSQDAGAAGSSWGSAVLPGALSAALWLLPGLLGALAPVPLLLAWRRFGHAAGLRASLAGTGILLGLGLLGGLGEPATAPDPWTGVRGIPPVLALLLGYGLVAVLGASILAWALDRTADGIRALRLAIPVYLAVLGTVGATLAAGLEGGPWGAVERWVEGSVDRTLERGRDRAAVDERWTELVRELEERRAFYERQATRFFPSLVVVAVTLGLWINLVYSRWFLGGKGKDDDLCTFRLPMGAMYAFMACAAGAVLQVGPVGERLPRVEPLLRVALNGLLVLACLYWLQGVAVTNYWFLRLRMGPLPRMAGIGAQVVMMAFPLTSASFGAAGLADAWFDFRRLERPEGRDGMNGSTTGERT